MTRYYVFHCENGFTGCDEDFYEAVEDEDDIEEVAKEILHNSYSFVEPDGRFCGKSFDDELTDEEIAEYEENLNVWYEEISKEQYDEEQE